jgi:uncharacterized protein (UPF0335 family)
MTPLNPEPDDDGDEPDRDFAKMFDLDRSTLIKTLVDAMEQTYRDTDAARDSLKEIVSQCRAAEFPPRDIIAMKRIARLRKDDKGGEAREQLAALERIGHAVGYDLFDWAAQA